MCPSGQQAGEALEFDRNMVDAVVVSSFGLGLAGPRACGREGWEGTLK